MQVSFAGMAVCAAVLILGYCCRGTLIVGLLASLAFGSTALVTLSSLGGSSPLIFTVFAALLVLSLTARRRIWHDLGHVFGKARPIWVLFCLLIYTVAGAWFLPRLFAGKTTAFTQSALYRGIVVETPLAPVSGNISQTAYFLAGGLAAIALCTMLVHGDRLAQVRRGFFVWCILHAGLGVLDLGGKLAGAGDVLLPIRTASYAMLTQSTAAGFWRIAGPYSEASAFGAASLACLAFTYTYWRKTGSWPAKHLSVILLALLLLSTSSTAYVGLAVISVPVAFSMFLSFVSGRFPRHDILLVSAFSLGLLAVLALALQREGFFDAIWQFIDSMILNKVNSDSGHQRTYWNVRSLQTVFDTVGLGVGMGSSRASSWLIAVLSQLGLVGSVLMATLVAVVAWGMGGLGKWADAETNAIVASVRASALASIVGGSISGGTADPGLIFFIALAVIVASRVRARAKRADQSRRATWIYTGPATVAA